MPTGSAPRDLSQRIPLTGGGDAFDQLGAQINAMLDRISALMEELRLLTDSLAHDLRSPVSRLRSAAHAATETSDPKEQEELLGSVIRHADSLMRILTSVLEISRSEALTGRNQFAWFDAGELSAELTEMYEPLAEERGAVLRFERPDRATPLYGHRQLLAQAISNLVENAIRYGSAGGEIRVGVRPSEGAVRIEVADRGPGIPEALRGEARAPLRPARFEPFRRRRRARPRAGRGDHSPAQRQAAARGQSPGLAHRARLAGACGPRLAAIGDEDTRPYRRAATRRAQPSMTTFEPTLVRP